MVPPICLSHRSLCPSSPFKVCLKQTFESCHTLLILISRQFQTIKISKSLLFSNIGTDDVGHFFDAIGVAIFSIVRLLHLVPIYLSTCLPIYLSTYRASFVLFFAKLYGSWKGKSRKELPKLVRAFATRKQINSYGIFSLWSPSVRENAIPATTWSGQIGFFTSSSFYGEEEDQS